MWLKNTHTMPWQNNFAYNISHTDKYWYINVYNKGLYITDTNFNTVLMLDNASGLLSNSIYHLAPDSRNNLWVCTDNGINYVILNSPISYLDKKYGLDKLIPDITFHNKNIYLSENYIIKYLPLDSLFSAKSTKKFKNVKNSGGQSWSFDIVRGKLLIGHNPSIMEIKNDSAFLYKELVTYNVWGMEATPDSSSILCATSSGVVNVQIDKTLKKASRLKGIDDEVTDIIYDKNGLYWFLVMKDKYQIAKGKIDTTNNKIDIIKKYSIVTDNNYEIVLINKDKDGNIFVDANKTLYKYNRQSDSFEIYTPITKYFNPGESEIYLLGIDDHNNFWVNEVKIKSQSNANKYKIYLLRNKGNDEFTLNRYLTSGIIYRDFSCVKQYKNYVFLGTTSGLAIFNYDFPLDLSENKFNVYLRKIESTHKDSLLWGGTTIGPNGNYIPTPPVSSFKYQNNGLRFYVGTDFYENPELTEFSYKLEGLDDQWTAWTHEAKKEYSFLKEGHYTFKVKAKNIYGIESPVLEYEFQIYPPWYRTPWAYATYAILIILLFGIILRLYTLNLRKRNIKLEELVSERTKEIQLKNLELEQQKEEIQTQAEELAAINEELEKLSYIVEWTDNAILLTDKQGNFTWVNPAFTKIFGYTLEELKAEVSKNIISERTDPKIKEKILQCINDKKTVEYETQFKTKWGTKLWVHTTLTPILNDENELTGLIAIDSDITKFKEAEEQIKIQNENIKGSIRYAQTIQKSVLPQKEELDKFFENFIIFKPKDIVSGDFYWISKTFRHIETNACKSEDEQFKPGNYMFIAVVDCTGHGVPGAFMSLIGTRLLNDVINNGHIHDPALALEKIDAMIAGIFKNSSGKRRDGMVMSLCKLEKICYEGKTIMKVTFAGAKQNIFYYRNAEKKMVTVRGTRRTLGELFTKIQFENQKFYLVVKNDMLFLFTDGYKDQNNAERKKIGIKQMERIILDNIDKGMSSIEHELDTFLDKWMEQTEQRDDITIIGLKINKL